MGVGEPCCNLKDFLEVSEMLQSSNLGRREEKECRHETMPQHWKSLGWQSLTILSASI